MNIITEKCVKEAIDFVSNLNDKEFTKTVHEYNKIQENVIGYLNGFVNVYKNERKKYSSFFVLLIVLKSYYKAYDNIPFITKEMIERTKHDYKSIMLPGGLKGENFSNLALDTNQPKLVIQIMTLLHSKNKNITSLTETDSSMLLLMIFMFIKTINKELELSVN